MLADCAMQRGDPACSYCDSFACVSHPLCPVVRPERFSRSPARLGACTDVLMKQLLMVCAVLLTVNRQNLQHDMTSHFVSCTCPTGFSLKSAKAR